MNLLSNLWSVFWSVLIVFAFIAYLMALFSVIGDLFRDSGLKGWAKAIWMVFLFFVPFLTVLLYLLFRGDGMARRQNSVIQKAAEDTETYIRSVATASPAQAIAQAKELLDSGTITDEEFMVLKAKALT